MLPCMESQASFFFCSSKLGACLIQPPQGERAHQALPRESSPACLWSRWVCGGGGRVWGAELRAGVSRWFSDVKILVLAGGGWGATYIIHQKCGFPKPFNVPSWRPGEPLFRRTGICRREIQPPQAVPLQGGGGEWCFSGEVEALHGLGGGSQCN